MPRLFDEKRDYDVEGKTVVTNLTGKDLEPLLQVLRDTVAEHELDPNFPVEILERARAALSEDPSQLDSAHLQSIIAEVEAERELLLNDSPYMEVRAVVDNTDDPTIPVNTFRVWTLGILFAILGTGIDQFFSLRYPGIYLYSFIAQLLSYP